MSRREDVARIVRRKTRTDVAIHYPDTRRIRTGCAIRGSSCGAPAIVCMLKNPTPLHEMHRRVSVQESYSTKCCENSHCRRILLHEMQVAKAVFAPHHRRRPRPIMDSTTKPNLQKGQVFVYWILPIPPHIFGVERVIVVLADFIRQGWICDVVQSGPLGHEPALLQLVLFVAPITRAVRRLFRSRSLTRMLIANMIELRTHDHG